MKAYQSLQKIIMAGQPFRAGDALAQGVSYQMLLRACNAGVIERIHRGIYVPADKEFDAESMYELAFNVVPYGILCLLSALEFHSLTTQLPHEVWLAVPQGKRHKVFDYPPVRYISLSEAPYSYGIEEHVRNGVPLKVYSVAKTIADCFKFRNKIGLDIALEALREGLQKKLVSGDELWKAAKICRVEKIMAPYREGLQL